MDPKEKKKMEEEELKTKSDENSTENEEQLQDAVNEEAQTETPLSREEELEKQIEELNEQINDQKDKYLRLSAEFDNYRKRTMKEKAELILNGSEKSIVTLLPVLDDMERALKTMETAKDVEAVKEGVDLIYNKFISILSQNGVKIIETANLPLDTDYHEAIAVVPAPSEDAKGKILDTVQTGYTMNDKVIRHAKVVVGE
ncbi:nucleotide exchange factor GrpE [Bacteroides sp. 224]|uniref:nucleotide exchange factor GrpE n=1 Tax=Bacteroides sp. 224 TaxID=2302936 RepID=UPI0013D799DD|nr:nucleotide exchange factor GrpE [Bacteroides sp. 224]NDV65997.1 nucleotide exchange factor GrpE [Bacteroides sp. 224]